MARIDADDLVVEHVALVRRARELGEVEEGRAFFHDLLGAQPVLGHLREQLRGLTVRQRRVGGDLGRGHAASLRARDLLSNDERDELLFVPLREPEHAAFFGAAFGFSDLPSSAIMLIFSSVRS